MSEINPGAVEKILEGLDQHSKLLSKEEIKAELVARGLDVENYLKETNALIEGCLKKERLAWMKEADEKKLRIVNSAPSIPNWLERSKDEIESAFIAWMSHVAPTEALGFRNKTDLTIEDKARLLNQHESLIKRTEKEPT